MYSGNLRVKDTLGTTILSLVGRLSSFRKLKMYYKYTFGDMGSVLCREVVPFSEGPLLEVPLYRWLQLIVDAVVLGHVIYIVIPIFNCLIIIIVFTVAGEVIRHHSPPMSNKQKLDNIQAILSVVNQRGVSITGINPEGQFVLN